MEICVIGCGYVGLVTGACLAETGNRVICLDVDEERISQLKAGKCPLMEPQLAGLIEKNLKAGRIAFSTSYAEGVPDREVVFICVQTPEDEDGSCDLKFVKSAVNLLIPYLSPETIVVTKSTVPVGTTEEVEEMIGRATSVPFYVANNPEFLREGSAVSDFTVPDRIVIGTDSNFASQKLSALFRSFVNDESKILVMRPRSSELVKYASNAMLAMRISFANEVANLSEKVGASYKEVKLGVGKDSRIGHKFLDAGVGFGGSCFPKDLRALIRLGEDFNEQMLLARATEQVNKRQVDKLLEKIEAHFNRRTDGKLIAVWGLSYKPNTDDMRRAPSIGIVRNLVKRGFQVNVFDPGGYEQARKVFDNTVSYFEDSYSAIASAHGLVLVTEWSEFSNPDFKRIADLLEERVIFDGRNLWERRIVESYGLKYYGVGT